MEKERFEEMLQSFQSLEQDGTIVHKKYRNVPIIQPDAIMLDKQKQVVVLIVARAYAAMTHQLKRLGFQGEIRKLVDYNSYADYSLSDRTVSRMLDRVSRGQEKIVELTKNHDDTFKILCPFQALGDIYIMMSYLPYYLKKKNVKKCVICVIGNACAQVVQLFMRYRTTESDESYDSIEYQLENIPQKSMDEIVQAALYTQTKDVYIAHQDRPYVVNLFKALYIKKIPLEQIYCAGVFGLPVDTEPVQPLGYTVYPELNQIKKGNAVILSPYAKSVTSLPDNIWGQITSGYNSYKSEDQ